MIGVAAVIKSIVIAYHTLSGGTWETTDSPASTKPTSTMAAKIRTTETTIISSQRSKRPSVSRKDRWNARDVLGAGSTTASGGKARGNPGSRAGRKKTKG